MNRRRASMLVWASGLLFAFDAGVFTIHPGPWASIAAFAAGVIAMGLGGYAARMWVEPDDATDPTIHHHIYRWSEVKAHRQGDPAPVCTICGEASA